MLGGSQQIILVDEPEAFLHPPQARQLGGVLAGRTEGKQSFIATHSADVLLGALEAEAPTTIVRITRDGDINHAAVLSHAAVSELWSDPLLRYSNLLDGLFHDAVILCEGDADCRYYAAVLDALDTADDEFEGKAPQILFTHCGGKARMPSVIKALRSARVPVIVVADFDVLRNRNDIENICSAIDPNSFSTLEADWNVLTKALGSDSKPLRKTALKGEILAQIDDLDDQILTPSDIKKLRSLLHADDGWDKAKRAGLHSITQGDATMAGRRLLGKLDELGVLVVPVGELERFVPEVPGHGPVWVTAVLEQELHKSPSPGAAEFVKKLRATASRVAAAGSS
jgi:hypothetical protein